MKSQSSLVSTSAAKGVLVALTGPVNNASHSSSCLGRMALTSAQNAMCCILIVEYALKTSANVWNAS